MTKITIGARGSKLSLAYVFKVKELLIKNNHDVNLGIAISGSILPNLQK